MTGRTEEWEAAGFLIAALTSKEPDLFVLELVMIDFGHASD